MKHYHHLMLGDEPHVQDENGKQYRYDGPAFEGVKPESEIEFFWQMQNVYGDWIQISDSFKLTYNDTEVKYRQAALLKEQPNRSEIPNSSESQKQALIEVMQADEKDGLYEEGLRDMKTTIELAEIAAEEDADSVTFYDTYKEGSEELTIYRNGRESGFMKGVGWLLNQLSSKQ